MSESSGSVGSYFALSVMLLGILCGAGLICIDELSNNEGIIVGAEGITGAFGLLPRHIDFVEALQPGILVMQTESGDEQFAAIDRGILIKQGENVLISASNAVLGDKLGSLKQTVAEEFEELDEREKKSRSALAKLESDFIRRFIEQPR